MWGWPRALRDALECFRGHASPHNNRDLTTNLNLSFLPVYYSNRAFLGRAEYDVHLHDDLKKTNAMGSPQFQKPIPLSNKTTQSVLAQF